jgi:hypothetical protein
MIAAATSNSGRERVDREEGGFRRTRVRDVRERGAEGGED